MSRHVCLERVAGEWQLPTEYEPEAIVVYVAKTGLWLWWAHGEMGDSRTRDAAMSAAESWLAQEAVRR